MTQAYVGGWGREDAEIMFVGEAISYAEEYENRPFAKDSGFELANLLKPFDFSLHDAYLTNVIRHRPPQRPRGQGVDLSAWVTWTKKESKDKTFMFGAYVSTQMLEHISHLKREIEIVKPRMIVALGNTALWALTGKRGINDWRGSQLWLQLPGCSHTCKVIPTFHPAHVLRFSELRRIVKRDLKRAFDWMQIEGDGAPDWQFTIRPSFQQTSDFFAAQQTRLKQGPVKFAVDIETRSKQIACVGIATSRLEAICIPIMCAERREGYWSFEEELVVIEMLRDLLTHPNARIIGQNFHYDDFYFTSCWGFRCNTYSDTMIRWHVLLNCLEKRLSFLCSLMCEYYVYWKDDGKEWDFSIPEEQYWIYNCTDCVRTFEADEVLDVALAKSSLTEQAQFEMDLFDPVSTMITRGMLQDVAEKKRISLELTEEITKRLDWLAFVFGHPVNPNSTSQMRDLIYGDLGIKKIFHRKTGELTLDESALDKMAEKEPLLRPIVQIMEQLRSLKVFKGTFADAEIDSDNRIRTHFWIPGTTTFRFSSKKNPFGSGANLQNIPKGNEAGILELLKQQGSLTASALAEKLKKTEDEIYETLYNSDNTGLVDSGFVASGSAASTDLFTLAFSLPNIRKIFIPDPGYTLIKGDLKGADFRVVIWESQDKNLKALLDSGLDIHTELSKILKLKRQDTKILVHATDYYAQAAQIAKTLGLTVHRAHEAQKAYFSFAPGIKDFQTRVIDNLQTHGFVTNAFGFRMYFFGKLELSIPDALAAIPQSTVAITINKGMLNVHRNIKEAQLLLQVHDEIDLQVPDELFPGILPELDKQMRITIPYAEPLVIPLSYAYSKKSWGDLVDIKV